MPAQESASTLALPTSDHDGHRSANMPPPPDLTLDEVKALTDRSCISALLKQLNQHEQRVDHELDELLGNKERLQKSMCSLMRLNPALQLLHTDAQQLGSTIDFTCDLAEHVSSKVRELDLAQKNVQQTIQYAQDLLDLKACVEGVEEAMKRKDYEQAAQHIHRYLSFDPALLSDNLEMCEDTERKGTTRDRLEKATDELRKIANKILDDAVRDNNEAEINRYVKLFPLLGIDEAGLKKYCHFVCAQIAEHAQANLKKALQLAGQDTAKVQFVNLLSLMFEDIASRVNRETPILEAYYGDGRALVLLQALQRECDRQVASILDSFINARRVHKLVTEVNTARMNRQGRSQKETSGTGEMQGGDVRELDALLWELSALINRGEAFDAFMRSRAKAEHERLFAFTAEEDTARRLGTSLAFKRQSSVSPEQLALRAKKAQEIEAKKARLNSELGKELLDGAVSGMNRRIQEIMNQYILLEQHFMAQCVQKAVKMDTLADEDQHVSTMVDDVFFVVQKCTRRALSSQQADCVCAVFNNANTILEEDFGGVLRRRTATGVADTMAGLFSGQSDLKDVLGQMKKMDTTPEARAKDYLINLNNVETSEQYTVKLHDMLSREFSSVFGRASERVRQKGETCIADILSTSKIYRHILEEGMEKMFATRVAALIYSYCEPVLSSSYVLTDNELVMNEVNDPFAQELIRNLDALLSTFKRVLTDGNYDMFSRTFAAHLASTLESLVLQLPFNQNGGIQLDKEVRMLVAYLSTTTEWTVRDKFARLTQMATLLSLDKLGDVQEYWSGDMVTWRLTPAEVRKVLSLRVDFPRDEVAKLKL